MLEFAEGTVLAGAQVRVSLDMSIRDFLALQRTIAGLRVDPAAIDDAALDRWERAYRVFGKTALKSWNLEVAGQPVEASEDGFLSLPFSVANDVFTAWAKALAGPSPNSNGASVNGAQSEAPPVETAAA